MNLIGTALAGIYVVVATWSASATSQENVGSAESGGVDITCGPNKTMNFAVSQPDATVTVLCPDTLARETVSETSVDNIYIDADCSKAGVPSIVCPGATVSTAKQDGKAGDMVKEKAPEQGTIVTLGFPQLPASQQVVCVKCPDKTKSGKDCKAVITVAAAPARGPQACAVGGSSITLEINEAAGSAQFKCGKDRTLLPSERTKAYADDCSKIETLKDMTRSDAPSEGGYLTLKVEKLKKKKLCYLCHPGASSGQQRGGEGGDCKVYVQVSGSTKFSSSVPYGLALPCLAAMVRLT